jgi:hypothetical protein
MSDDQDLTALIAEARRLVRMCGVVNGLSRSDECLIQLAEACERLVRERDDAREQARIAAANATRHGEEAQAAIARAEKAEAQLYESESAHGRTVLELTTRLAKAGG